MFLLHFPTHLVHKPSDGQLFFLTTLGVETEQDKQHRSDKNHSNIFSQDDFPIVFISTAPRKKKILSLCSRFRPMATFRVRTQNVSAHQHSSSYLIIRWRESWELGKSIQIFFFCVLPYICLRDSRNPPHRRVIALFIPLRVIETRIYCDQLLVTTMKCYPIDMKKRECCTDTFVEDTSGGPGWCGKNIQLAEQNTQNTKGSMLNISGWDISSWGGWGSWELTLFPETNVNLNSHRMDRRIADEMDGTICSRLICCNKAWPGERFKINTIEREEGIRMKDVK